MVPGRSFDADAVEDALRGLPVIELKGLFRRSSNYTFLTELCDPASTAPPLLAVYKPAEGESPLWRSEEHTSELQSRSDLVCRLLLEKKNQRSKRCSTAPPKTVSCDATTARLRPCRSSISAPAAETCRANSVQWRG